ncbi:transcriptional repressor LexA [Prochlorothrix hollandica]|uniref:LexA repressor n=1 Tax=Prochlorothrix hollandica PCC 9006 = CALU 1027 TaxID=317619 RepID=A0A0M2PNA7_PROHO|nr:transcriptional repressor LexA [Prochlorothrix hollandica]KKI98095.1 LexA family transcriptional repressor [Prochlorothrix hollandica PCC 9006 = CALU 1027]
MLPPLTVAQEQLYDWLVKYIHENQHPPSIRQMMKAMGLKSPAPVQSRLKHLQKKGYIDWNEGKARTIRVLAEQGIPIVGEIAAGTLIEPFTDELGRLDITSLVMQPTYYALRVNGDSMIDEMIQDGDVVIMKPVRQPDLVRDGEIVAARVMGAGNTLKRFFRFGNVIRLEAANRRYAPIEVDADYVELQGVLVGVWRGYQ